MGRTRYLIMEDILDFEEFDTGEKKPDKDDNYNYD